MKDIAMRNIKLQGRISFLSELTFLVPIITLFYTYTWLSIAEIILLSNVSTLTVWLFEIPTSVFADTTWRKKSLVWGSICSVLSAVCILFFPSFIGFSIAAICGWLYFALRSGTTQAFLEENLKIIGKTHEFWKKLGHFMSLENIAWLIVSIVITIFLKYWGDQWYIYLAILDVITAWLLVMLTLKLKEVGHIKAKIQWWRDALIKNYITAKTACINVFTSKKLRTLMMYRSLANHVAFLFIISLPIRVEYGMPPRMAGILGMIGIGWMIISNKYAYKVAEKWSYNHARVFSTIAQAILLIIAWICLKSWITITVIMILFNFFEWLRMPAWNHVLVWLSKGMAIATTRSIIFSVFALYTTIGKQFLALFDLKYALIGLGIFIIIVNIVLGKKILKLK